MTIYKLLWYLLHFVIRLWTFVTGFISHILNVLSSKPQKTSLNLVRENCLRLQKLPEHIGFVVVEEDISIIDLVKLMVWSAASGIMYISVYDKFGFIKSNRVLVEEGLSKELAEHEKKKYHFTVYEGCVRKTHPRVSNGIRHIDVHLLTASDGRERLVHLTKKLSGAVLRKQYEIKDITPSNIDSILHDEQGFPDPDVVVRFGRIESLLGYLPWQSRLTEILSLPTHHHISYSSLHRLLTSYGCTEQRFGK